MQNQILTLAGIGCGGRTLTYFELAMMHFSHRFKIVAAADPNPIRLERARILSKNPDFRAFLVMKSCLLKNDWRISWSLEPKIITM